MFTGLIETTAEVVRLDAVGDAADLVLELPPVVAADLEIGASLAVDGACLTVTAIDGAKRTFRMIAETLARTSLGGLATGGVVNVERALRLGDRLGGHWVQGHVDGVGTLAARTEEPGQTVLRVDVPSAMTSQMVPKGSITLAGVSLTLVDVGASHFTVALIPETLSRTTLGRLAIGSRVNVETDILAKYVARLGGGGMSSGG